MALTKPRSHQLADLTVKSACRVVTTANVSLSAAPNVVDNISLAAGNRVLVAAQSDATKNGIYRVQTAGTGSNGVWVRSSDADNAGEIKTGLIVYVSEGSVYHDTQWKLTTDDPITLNTTELTFDRITSGTVTSIQGGTGITANTSTGDVTLSINSSVVTLSGTQTLTNKTLTSPAVSGGTINNAVIGGTTPAAGSFTTGDFSSDVVISGNLTVNGTTTTINTSTYSVRDPVILLGGSALVDDNKDRGIQFNWNDGSSTKTGFFGFDDSTGYFTFVPDATNSSEVFSGTSGDIKAGKFIGTSVKVNSIADIDSASTTNTGTFTLDSWSTSAYRSAKYEYQVTQGTSYQVGELRIFHDGSTAMLNEYGVMGSSLASFSVSVSAGSVVLTCTVASSSTVKLIRKLIVV